MNERIRELAFECARQLSWTPPSDPKEYTFSSAGLEKFAELIVQECFGEVMCQLYDYSPSSNEQYNAGHEAGLKLAVNKIKQHFGVEE